MDVGSNFVSKWVFWYSTSPTLILHFHFRKDLVCFNFTFNIVEFMIRKIEFNRFTLDHWSPKLTSNARTKGSEWGRNIWFWQLRKILAWNWICYKSLIRTKCAWFGFACDIIQRLLQMFIWRNKSDWINPICTSLHIPLAL